MATEQVQERPLKFLITGGARGVGRGMARSLHAKGHHVFLVDFNEGELKNTVSKLDGKANPPGHFVGDVTILSDIDAAVKAASTFFGGHLDCLVNNAFHEGAGPGTIPMEELSLDEWHAVIEANLTAPFFLSQGCLAMLIAARGCIVNLASTRARQSEPHGEAFAASTAGVLGLTHAMASTLSKYSIRVNAIMAGWVYTEHESRRGDEKKMKWFHGPRTIDHRWHWSRRVGMAEDIVKAVEYLVSAEFVTGQELVVDGGASRRMAWPSSEITDFVVAAEAQATAGKTERTADKTASESAGKPADQSGKKK